MTTRTLDTGGPRGAAAAETAYPRLLVATAGDPDSRGALAVAAALTERDDSQVMALGVAVPFPHDLSGILSARQPSAIAVESRRHTLDDLRHSLQAVAAADRWMKQVLVGLPADTINTSAATWRASLIILGLGHHSRIDRLFGRETAIAVMRHACVPVLAVPPSAEGLPRHALVAVDFTPASIAAAEGAAALVAAGGTVTVAHVCAFGGVKARAGDLVDLYRAGARTKLDEAVEMLRGRTPRRVEGAMLDGEPGQALLAYARSAHCDLLSLGGHEQGLMDRILLGSVRTRVLRGARCSVLIAPPRAPS